MGNAFPLQPEIGGTPCLIFKRYFAFLVQSDMSTVFLSEGFHLQNIWYNIPTAVDPGYIIENSNLAFDWKSVEMTPDLLVNTQICLVFVWEQHHSLS